MLYEVITIPRHHQQARAAHVGQRLVASEAVRRPGLEVGEGGVVRHESGPQHRGPVDPDEGDARERAGDRPCHGRRVDVRRGKVRCVITSYSIHYTKLYEVKSEIRAVGDISLWQIILTGKHALLRQTIT